MENLLTIGTIVGTHHLLGTVKVNSIFEDFEAIIGEKILIERAENKKILTVKNIKRINEKKLLVNFDEINNIDKAKEINGFKIKIRRDLLPEKNKNEFYMTDLFGMDVFEKNLKIGEVLDIIETAAHEILVIKDVENNKEFLIPLIEEFVVNIDFENNKINVNLIEGMRQ